MIILIVEDEEPLAEMLSEELYDAGYVVLGPAATAEEAFQEAARTKPDLALVDINLKDGSRGTEVVPKLHQHLRVPSLYLTSAPDEAKANRSGAIGVVTKPYRIATVLQSIEIARSLLRGEAPPSVPDGFELFH